MYSERDLFTIFDHYVICALWSGVDWDVEGEDEPEPLDDKYGPDDLSDEATATIFEELCEFLSEARQADLDRWSHEQLGHDICLTRNHHGAGFWDRGQGAAGERLTEIAHHMGGSADLYAGDDGKLYV